MRRFKPRTRPLVGPPTNRPSFTRRIPVIGLICIILISIFSFARFMTEVGNEYDTTFNRDEPPPIQIDPEQLPPVQIVVDDDIAPQSHKNISCVVLHKTHKTNANILDRIGKAQRQIIDNPNVDCRYTVLYWIDKPGDYSVNQTRDIEMLIDVVGSDSLFVVDYDKTDTVFPHLFKQIKTIGWLAKGNYAWELADIPEMVYYAYFKNKFDSTLNPIIWSFEYDIGWTNDISTILLEYIDIDRKYDYLAYDCIEKQSKWSHYYKTTHPFLKDNEMDATNVEKMNRRQCYSCLIQLTRYKPWLLQSMIDEINGNYIVYCEIRAAMICRRSPDCELSDMRRSHKFDDAFGWHWYNGQKYPLFFSGQFISEQFFANETAHTDPNEMGRLYHRLKW